MTAKSKFRALAAVYEAVNGRKTETVEEPRRPVWAPRRCRRAVYFREVGMPGNQALLTGCGPSYESAYRQLLEFYMDKLDVSEEELELRAAVSCQRVSRRRTPASRCSG